MASRRHQGARTDRSAAPRQVEQARTSLQEAEKAWQEAREQRVAATVELG
ncbi:MAG: hypothetical protein AB1505_07950 [Candidatus Latescibacterota bacterium]